jgi:protein ImuB
VFDSRLELFARADTTEQVLHGAAVLLKRLVAWAQAQHARVGGFTLRMHHEPRHREGRAVAECSTLEVALAEPSADAAHLQLLLRERLANAELAAPTLELSLQCRQAVKGAPPNGELFPTPGSEREGLTRLVERLQARLGRDRVQQLHARSDHRPECTSVAGPADPLAGAAASPWAPSRGEPASPAPRISRPVWLLPEPEPLAERQLKPLLDGQPLQLLSGPERIETGWWDGAPAQRDYFIAQSAEGALVWIYRDRLPRSLDGQALESGWYLQGRFG